MKSFDPNYKLLDEMYQDDYYPAFLVDKVKDELQKVIDLLELVLYFVHQKSRIVIVLIHLVQQFVIGVK